MKDIQKEFLDNRNPTKDLWRMFRVISDFTDAFEELEDLPPQFQYSAVQGKNLGSIIMKKLLKFQKD